MIFVPAIAKTIAICLLNLSASNLDQFEKDHWLSSELNVFCLRLTEPAFTLRNEPSTPRNAAPTCKRRWTGSPHL